MSAGVGGSKGVLASVRDYVHVLIAAIVLISAFLVGYLYWHNIQLSELESVANHYHLESMLHCTEIKEAVHHAIHSAKEGLDDALREAQSRQNAYADAVYLVERSMRGLGRLHADFAEKSNHAARIEPVLRKIKRQFAELKTGLRATRGVVNSPATQSAMPAFRSYLHSVEQLRRLHAIAKDEFATELEDFGKTSDVRLITIFVAMLLLGSIVAWRIVSGIRRLVEEQGTIESALRQSATVFENTSEGVLITDADANIVAVNKAFTEITGYSQEEVLGSNPRILGSGLHDREFYRSMWSDIEQHGQWRGEVSDRRKNGEVFPKWLTISAVHDDDGKLTHYVSVFSDISQLKESAEQLYQLAHHDALTGLPNRLLLDARLEHSLQHATREGDNVAVLFLDLDHFKKVNDSMGHPAGDRLLQHVAKRLLASVRQDDTVARLGGDELTIILSSLDDPRGAAPVAQELLDTLAEPFQLRGQEIYVSASIGISVFPQDGHDVTTLLRNADAAMYMAKKEGRNRYHFYAEELTVKASESLALEAHLHRAVEREELVLHYQPQVSLKSGDIVGLEALVRWQHPELGLVPPVKFIPLAEEIGLIGVIGRWVLRTACKQAKAWQDAGGPPIRISVNLSGRQLAQSGIAGDIRQVLEDTGLEPSRLELELTESTVMKRAELAAKTLDELRALGTTIAIDDFGTGYSSLSYLKRFSVDRLKIDRSFVRDIPQDANDVALAKAIVVLARSLDLGVVAEGIETEAQRDLLTSMGCDEMQGYLYSAPVPASDVESLLKAPQDAACIND